MECKQRIWGTTVNGVIDDYGVFVTEYLQDRRYSIYVFVYKIVSSTEA